jgi:hypothetical protein
MIFFDFVFPYVRDSSILPGREPVRVISLQLNRNPRT